MQQNVNFDTGRTLGKGNEKVRAGNATLILGYVHINMY